MAFKFFMVPVHSGDAVEIELNTFLSSHRVLSIDRRFIDRGENSCWAFCVDYQASTGKTEAARKKARIDYKEVLAPEQFQTFVQLRELRSALAQADAVPVYTIFTNEQLAAIVQGNVQTRADMEAIPGIGEGRASKYGEAFLDIMRGRGAQTG